MFQIKLIKCYIMLSAKIFFYIIFCSGCNSGRRGREESCVCSRKGGKFWCEYISKLSNNLTYLRHYNIYIPCF